MQKYIAKISLLAIIFLSFLSCEQVIDIDMGPRTPSLVVNGFLNPDSIFSVQVSTSKLVTEIDGIRPISDARVSVYEGEQKLGELQHHENGLYRLADVYPQYGKEYTLRVEHESFPSVRATEKVLSEIPPIQILTEKLESAHEYEENIRFTFKLQDPAGERNYYRFRAFQEQTKRVYERGWEDDYTEITYLTSLWLQKQDQNLEEICGHGNGCDYVLNDTFFDGKSYEVHLTTSIYNHPGWHEHEEGEEDEEEEDKSGPKIYIAAYHISEAAYLYYKTLDNNIYADEDPFSEPVRVYSNVEGGFGVWVAVSGKMIRAEF